MGVEGARISNGLMNRIAMRNINHNMRQMLDLQYQMTSGLRLYKTSIDPGAAAVAMGFQALTERHEQSQSNITRSNEFLAATDSALGDLQDLLNEASSVASKNIGAATDDEARHNAATVVGSLINQLTQIGNRQYQDRYLFAGRATEASPFDLSGTRTRFRGDLEGLFTRIDRQTEVQGNLTADEVFGSLSGRVTSKDDLNPDITLSTRLSELHGGEGVRRGSIILSDGAANVSVDLGACDTVQDVVNAINNNGVVGITAGINTAGNGLLLQGGAADTISVKDEPGGYVARDLGIIQETPLAAGADLVGGDLDRRLTSRTELSALNGGAGFDQNSGLRITLGAETEVIDFDSATTVEDLLNEINHGPLDLRAWIDDDGRRLIIANTVPSESMSIGENNGTTATDLGLRSMPASMLLSDLNSGRGVRTVAGADDFALHTRDGSTIGVNLDGTATVGDVVDAINNDADNGGKVVAQLNLVGNGLRLIDMTLGGNDFRVERTNSSAAAPDLGIEKSVTPPVNVITGDDVAPVSEQGIFRHLVALRDALLADDSGAISHAGMDIQEEISRVAQLRGIAGSRMTTLEKTKGRLEDEVLQAEGLLSEIRDLDYADAVARFQSLQSAYQASLQTTATMLPLSLMDFLNI